jgi:L-lactate dehydrogenase
VRSVAPFGGTQAVLTTNPIAYGIPTDGDPILIDQCTSVVSNAEVQEYAARGERTPGKWLVDPQGGPSDDASLVMHDPPATIMPLGGEEFGYKGFGFGLMVEALSLGLAGYGRSSNPDRFNESVFLQVIDPAGFAGSEVFLREMSDLAQRCRESPARKSGDQVRLPGQRALTQRTDNLTNGMPFEEPLIKAIQLRARRLNVECDTTLRG